MQTISVEAAQGQSALLSKSTDPNVREYAKALAGEADAAIAAGATEFDLATPATSNYRAATDALTKALDSGSQS